MKQTINPVEGVVTLIILDMIRRAFHYACTVVCKASVYVFWNSVNFGDALFDYMIFYSPVYVPLLYIVCKVMNC